jgi:biotin transport system substrate-specific component
MLKGYLKITGIKALDESLLIALALITICILGPLKLDLTNSAPITLQSLLVVWFGLAMGLRIGLTAVVLYLFVGGMGMEVFAGGASGWGHFLGSNGGFLIAFPVGAFISGALGRWTFSTPLFSKTKFISSALILLVSQLAILVLGLLWQSAISMQAISLVSIIKIFMPGLLIKTALGTLALVFISRAMSRIRS